MSNINFFGWIRDGVRQSVLLGVSDAIDQLGTPPATDELHPDVVAFLQNGAPAAAAAPMLAGVGGNGSTGGNGGSRGQQNRKRLGRSLKDIETVPQK
ncbi:MAG: hypothetical protein IT423_19820 [Pirellulaceae bacterium]|nr:hypothetical protein [Pirellulaceae bacterium]